MITDLAHAAWILEIELRENTAAYWCCDHTPTEKEFTVLRDMVLNKFSDVSMRILSKKEMALRQV